MALKRFHRFNCAARRCRSTGSRVVISSDQLTVSQYFFTIFPFFFIGAECDGPLVSLNGRHLLPEFGDISITPLDGWFKTDSIPSSAPPPLHSHGKPGTNPVIRWLRETTMSWIDSERTSAPPLVLRRWLMSRTSYLAAFDIVSFISSPLLIIFSSSRFTPAPDCSRLTASTACPDRSAINFVCFTFQIRFASGRTPLESKNSWFYHILPDPNGFDRVFTEFYRVLLSSTGFYWVLPGFTGFYWVLLGFTGFLRTFHYSLCTSILSHSFPGPIQILGFEMRQCPFWKSCCRWKLVSPITEQKRMPAKWIVLTFSPFFLVSNEMKAVVIFFVCLFVKFFRSRVSIKMTPNVTWPEHF